MGLNYNTYIYKITAPNGLIYIGKTVDFKRRMSEYKRNDTKKQPRLKSSIDRFGWESHTVEILFEGPCIPEELRYLEQFYIRIHNSTDPKIGLNISS